jgi:hypothetical protein
MKMYNVILRFLGILMISMLVTGQSTWAAPNLPLPWFELVMKMPVDLFNHNANHSDDSLPQRITRCVLDHDEVLTVRTDEFKGDRWVRQLDFRQSKADESLAIELLALSNEALKQKQNSYFVFSKAGPDFELSSYQDRNQNVLRGQGVTRLNNSVGRELVRTMVTACGLQTKLRKVRFQRWLSGAQGVPNLL